MIKIFLKHWIYELCIEKIFDGIYTNFDICTKKLTEYKVGEYINVLQITIDKDFSKYLTDCKIVYNDKKNLIIESNDNDIPILIFVKNKLIFKIMVKPLTVNIDYKALI